MKFSTGMIMTAAGSIVTIGAAASTIDELRWWPWRSEFKVVASETYKSAIRQNFDLLLLIQEAIRRCRAEQANDPMAPSCLDLLKQEHEYKIIIEELKKEQERVQQ